MSNNKPIRRVAIIGTGVIGASWAALFLAKGLDVVATDVAPDAEAALRRFVKAAWPALERLGLAPGASQSRLSFTPDMPAAVSSADFVQENGPERIDFKKKLYRQLDELLPADVIIASSSSGLTMSEIQSDCPLHPERCVIGHPFNPPHLVPLVEIVGGAKTSEATIRRAAEFYTGLGEAGRPSAQGSARPCRQSPAGGAGARGLLPRRRGRRQRSRHRHGVVLGTGPSLGHHGQLLLNHLGGGQGGIEHFFQQFTGPMTAWWKVLGSPILTPEVQKKLIDGVHAEVGSRSIAELEAQRDEILLGLLELRKKVEDATESEKAARVGSLGAFDERVRPGRRAASAMH